VVLYSRFDPRQALRLVLPDLTSISQVNAVVKNNQVVTTIHAQVKNESPFTLSIDSLYFQLLLNRDTLLAEKLPVSLEMKRFEADSLALPIHFSISKIRETIQSLEGRDSTLLELNCIVVYKTFAGKTRLRFDRKNVIAVPVPPIVRVLKVVEKKYHPLKKSMQATVKLEIINKGKYLDIELSKVHYELEIKNTLHASGNISKPIVIKPGATLAYDLPITISLDSPVKLLWKVARNQDKVSYNLKVTCLLKGGNFQLASQVPVEVDASGMVELIGSDH